MSLHATRWALGAACAALAACHEAPHEGVKLAPRVAASSATWPLAADPAASSPPAVSVPARAAASLPQTAPVMQPAMAIAAPPPALPGRLDGDAAPPVVQPGEPNGNNHFRQALQQRLERRAATP